MLKGFLPFKRTPPQENPLRKPNNTPWYKANGLFTSKDSNNDPTRQDLNLLGHHELFSKDTEIRYRLVLFFQLCIFIISTVLLILLFISWSYDTKLTALKRETDFLVGQMSGYSSDISQAHLVATRLNTYALLKKSRKEIGVPIEKVLSIAAKYVIVTDFKGDSARFYISAQAEDATTIVKMLYDLLKSGALTQLSLKSLDFSPNDKLYILSLEGIYK
jgi:hypothetical protein